MGASELGAGLACEHGTRSECQPLEWDRECQGLTGPRAATGGGGGTAGGRLGLSHCTGSEPKTGYRGDL